MSERTTAKKPEYTNLHKTLRAQEAFTTRNGVIVINKGFYPASLVIRTPVVETTAPTSADNHSMEQTDNGSDES